MSKMKGQYLSMDAIIASIIFILLIVSLFSYLRFSIFSQQFYEGDADSTIVYISSLLFSKTSSDYTLLNLGENGKILDNSRISPSALTFVSNKLNEITPYKNKIVVKCYTSPPSISASISYSDIRWISHIRRNALKNDGGNPVPCNVDIFIGVPK